jgi:hypothetical protein
MKNIHVIPTSKPSRIAITDTNVLGIYKVEQIAKYGTNQNIYITNLEEIKEGVDVKDKWVISEYGFVVKADKIENNYLIHSNGGSNFLHYYKFIILTTDQDLVGVQTIDDEFLKWFVKNPSCEEVEVELIEDSENHPELVGNPIEKWSYYTIIIPQEETLPQFGTKEFNDLANQYFSGKQETLEEVAENFWLNDNSMSDNDRISYVNGFLTCAKWQQEKSYSEEDMKQAFKVGFTIGYGSDVHAIDDKDRTFKKWFEQFKKK